MSPHWGFNPCFILSYNPCIPSGLKKYLLTREITSPASEKRNKLAEYFTTKCTKTYTENHKVTKDKKNQDGFSLRFFNSKGAGGFNPCIETNFSTAK